MSDAARALKARARKTVTLPHSGVEVVIRRIDQMTFLAHGGRGLLLAAQEQKDAPQTIPDEDAIQYIRALVAACLVSPRLWTGNPDECPDEQIILADLADDLIPLINAINTFHDLSKEAADAADSFRPDLGRDAGSDRQEVRGAAAGVAEAHSVGTDAGTGDLPDGDGIKAASAA